MEYNASNLRFVNEHRRRRCQIVGNLQILLSHPSLGLILCISPWNHKSRMTKETLNVQTYKPLSANIL